MPRDDHPPPSPAVNPAQEKTLPYAAPGDRDTAKNARTVPDNAPVSGPLDSTLRQDDRDARQSASESVHSRESPPTVPGYTFHDKLGHGTYGVVWRATEDSTSKQVALKFFHRRVGEMWQMVWAEIKQLALLDAVPGIIQLKDADPDAAPPYFVMNYAEGGSLATLLRKGPLPVPQALKVFRGMVDALAYVHAKGIRHCDLKPANILLDALGKPLIADFGQAHLSMDVQAGAGSVNLGTFYYMAPEQADLAKQIPDTRWDVYGLGAIFYAMVVGAPPRAHEKLTEELNQTAHLTTRLERYREGVAQSPPPDQHRRLHGMDRPLADIVEKCLLLDPAKRFQSAGDIAAALEQRDRYLRRRPLLFAGLAASILFILALGLLAGLLVHYAVRNTEATLEHQMLTNDKTTVQLVRNVVHEQMADVTEGVERLAQNPKLVAHAKSFLAELKPEQIADAAYVKNPTTDAFEKHLMFDCYRPGVTLLIFYGTDGTLLVGGYPEKEVDNTPAGQAKRAKRVEELHNIYGKNYAWRDYYHGQGDNLPADHKAPYVGVTYISEPYKSTLADESSSPILVAISTPVYDLKSTPDKGRPVPDVRKEKLIGILISFIYLQELYSWLEGVDLKGGSVALLNQHGQCVFHTDPHFLPTLLKTKDNISSRFKATRRVILANHLGQRTHYRDEITGQECLASFAAVPLSADDPAASRWGAMVLHYRSDVFEPIHHLRASLFRVIAVIAAICAALLGAVWFWLLRIARGREAAA